MPIITTNRIKTTKEKRRILEIQNQKSVSHIAADEISEATSERAPKFSDVCIL